MPDLPTINDTKTVMQLMKQLNDELKAIKANPADHVVENKAHCMYMCSVSQLEDSDRSNSHFEFDRNGQQFRSLAVKRFIRAAAGNIMGDPQDVRPPQVLWLTVRYLRDCIIDLDRCPKGSSFFQYEGQRFKPNEDYS